MKENVRIMSAVINRRQTYVMAFIAITLFLLPSLFWGNRYIVGGDDARLYYLFPWEYLRNFLFNIIGNNTLGGNLGYLPVSYPAPIIFFLYILKTVFPFANTQLVAYGLILSFGFAFFYLFLGEMYQKRTTFLFFCRVTAALFYVFSTYLIKTLFHTQLIPIYLVAVVPTCLYLFTLGLNRRSMVFIVCSSLVYSCFSSTILSAPWFLPVCICLIPLWVYLAWAKGTYFWKSIAVVIVTTLLFNAYWIVHYIIPLVIKTGDQNFTSVLLSPELKRQNEDVITALTYLNSPVSQMVQYIKTSWDQRQGVTVPESMGGIYLLVVLFGGMFLRNVSRVAKHLFMLSLSVLLVSMLFVTPNFGSWNVRLFQFSNDTIPFFSMLRTMYDKFALASAFSWAFVLFGALAVLSELKIRSVYRFFLIALLLVVTFVRAYPFIKPDYKDSGYSTRISGQFNPEFRELTRYIKEADTASRYLWLPMTFPGYVSVGDDGAPNSFYMGLSPLQILSRASDIAGFYGLSTPQDLSLNWKLLDLLKDGNYDAIGKIFQAQNIGYVIVNNESIPQKGHQALNGLNFMDYQTDAFKGMLLGKHIRDFGTRYGLYEINKDYFLPTVFITDDMSVFPPRYTPVAVRKLPDGDYEGTLLVEEKANLVFQEPHNRLWQLTLTDDDGGVPYRVTHGMAYGYGNVWTIESAGKGGIPSSVRFRIRFLPNAVTKPAVIVSIISIIAAFIYVSAVLIRRKK